MSNVLDVGGLLRRARRNADMSQRQLSAAAGVRLSTIARIESYLTMPNVDTLSRLLAATGHGLVVVDAAGNPIRPYDIAPRDRLGRRFPSHLDIREVGPNGEGWWGTYFPHRVEPERRRPAHTFKLNRDDRDIGRERAATDDD